MKRIRGLDEFRESLFCDDGSSKPVMIITVDGGPDENPRYSKTVMCSIDYFVSCNLDALFVATNAPGRSAYNRVERRMAPLSHDLAGIVLPHDHFGSHLNSAGLTVDEDMEAKNFEKAGQVLSEIWSETVIDGHPTVAEYISPSEDEMPMLKDQAWHKAHVRESQYVTDCQVQGPFLLRGTKKFLLHRGKGSLFASTTASPADGRRSHLSGERCQCRLPFLVLADASRK